jgi:hypothetical protein
MSVEEHKYYVAVLDEKLRIYSVREEDSDPGFRYLPHSELDDLVPLKKEVEWRPSAYFRVVNADVLGEEEFCKYGVKKRSHYLLITYNVHPEEVLRRKKDEVVRYQSTIEFLKLCEAFGWEVFGGLTIAEE